MTGATVYFLRCADGSYYLGITRRDIETRVSEHQKAIDPRCYTAARRPVTLLHAEHYDRVDEAVAAERRMKGWSRAKKEAYVRGDFDTLKRLAKRRT